jgi:hypothetical protein
MPDGKQFLVVLPSNSNVSGTGRYSDQINVVLNWFDELKQRVPAS